ncbi:hypothetical protein DFH11DRAFT_1511971, partial [Phellopilus nigrolimitatus]
VHGTGFDGVEIHGAHGYLVDQFTQDVSNKHSDQWGGSIENRTRLALEFIKRMTSVVGEECTAICLSPFSTFQGKKGTTGDVPNAHGREVVEAVDELPAVCRHTDCEPLWPVRTFERSDRCRYVLGLGVAQDRQGRRRTGLGGIQEVLSEGEQ